MIRFLDPVTAVLNVARSFKGWASEVGSNRGQAVEAFLAFVGLAPGNPWCAAFVAYVGRAVLDTTWPLPRVGGCASLGEAAVARGLLRDSPKVGDIFLMYSPTHQRFNHTGFVTSVSSSGQCGTVEGNTNAGGSPEGTGVFERTRTFGPRDRFIRWTEAS